MEKGLLISIFLMFLAFVITGCGAEDTAAQSKESRITSPDVNKSDVDSLNEGNREFAFDLYQSVRHEEGNQFFSPYSISVALAMTYAGARGDTEMQIKETMNFSLPQDRLHPAFNALDQTLAQRGNEAEGKDNQGFRLNIVNAIWGQAGYEFLIEYLDTLAMNYGAGIRLLDFVGDPEGSRNTINKWVSEETEGRIEELIPRGIIDGLTRLVLSNAINFNAAWEYPFEESWTEPGVFRMLTGEQVEVPMMKQVKGFAYGSGDGYQAVELPYSGRELSMLILVPDMGRFDEFENSLDREVVENIIDRLAQRQVALRMPKFEFEKRLGLAETLSAMGMPAAFSMQADFSGMDGTRDLFIQDVIHQAFVSVDEAGTEAAAATAVVMALKSRPIEEPVELNIDRPFIFLIRDIQTDTVLFLGRVVDPG
jgi:serpin B